MRFDFDRGAAFFGAFDLGAVFAGFADFADCEDKARVDGPSVVVIVDGIVPGSWANDFTYFLGACAR